ncbi:MAG: hypothetical protein IH618_05820 [Ignavibacteriaceae bacterium]|nr:hypothetical protein [Ignavibacteriaceae bacterium]
MKSLFLSLNSKVITVLFLSLNLIILFTSKNSAQDLEAKVDTVTASDIVLENTTAGEFTPSKGFTIVKTRLGSLNISAYGLARYVNQVDNDTKYLDHLGRERTVDPRQDITWHRGMLWFSGFFLTPKFRYCVTVWALASTNQTLLFGYMQYSFQKEINVAVGIVPNLSTRSMQGAWPFFLSSDRVLAEEFFRAGFTMGAFVTGEVLPKFYYNFTVGNNLSILGTTVSQLTRDLSTSASIWWMPTTGEFGPRGGYGDFEIHKEMATRFGASYTHMRENRQTPDDVSAPNETQVKLSDGVLFFETGALADGVTVRTADFDLLAVDAGVKYNGLHLQVEYYFRNLSKLDLIGPAEGFESVPNSIYDHGFYATISYEAIPKALQVYASTTQIFDQFKMKPWEIVGGMNFYPAGTRSLRLNLNVIYVEKSAASSSFGFYLGGLNGMSLSTGIDILI